MKMIYSNVTFSLKRFQCTARHSQSSLYQIFSPQQELRLGLVFLLVIFILTPGYTFIFHNSSFDLFVFVLMYDFVNLLFFGNKFLFIFSEMLF